MLVPIHQTTQCHTSYDHNPDNTFIKWLSIHVNCVSLPNAMKSEIKHVTFVVQWYSAHWQEKRSGNASYATPSKPIIGIVSQLLQV